MPTCTFAWVIVMSVGGDNVYMANTIAVLSPVPRGQGLCVSGERWWAGRNTLLEGR